MSFATDFRQPLAPCTSLSLQVRVYTALPMCTSQIVHTYTTKQHAPEINSARNMCTYYYFRAIFKSSEPIPIYDLRSNYAAEKNISHLSHYRMCTYKMQKKFKFCIDTRHFECTAYWFDIKYVIKHINRHKLQY